MNEEMVSYLREHPEGVSSQLLAQVFLKFKSPDANLSHTAIAAILKTDSRCFIDNERNWHATVKSKNGTSLLELPLTVIYCLSDPIRRVNKVLFISLWDLVPKQHSTLNTWLIDPQQLAVDQNETPLEETGFYEVTTLPGEIACQIDNKLTKRIPVFLSSYDSSLVSNLLSQHGYYLTDDIILVSELLRACDIIIPRPLTFQSFLETLQEQVIAPTEVRKAGQLMSSGILELLQRIIGKGIETREKMEESVSKDYSSYFTGKEFSEKTLQALPTTSGVYGFKNSNGMFIYIGKAKNLRRRLLGYFRDTGESPQKIKQLRDEARSFITYQCGSELEALIYEYRLIRKHTPTLNSKIDISERDGAYRAVQDCIILLPHANSDKVMSFWLRENQKIIMKPIEFENLRESARIIEMREYFFEDALPAEPTDFQEIELATRWIKSHRDCLQIIEVFNCADAEEVSQLLGFSIKEAQRNLADHSNRL